jgi:exodeoxyribonuclease VIII
MPPAATSAPLELRPLKKEPGVYPGMSFEEYTRIDAINFSVLSLFKDTAAHARFGLLKEDVPTPAQALGHAVHAAILEPERFARDFAVAPKVDRRTTPGKKAWRNFEAANLGKELVTYDQMTTCRGLLRSVSQHASAREVLYGPGASELVFVWLDEEYKVLCKSRLDRAGMLGGWPCFVDVKTMSDTASLRNMEKSIANYDYAEQAAMYLEGGRVLRPLQEGDRRFLWLACETFEPFLVRLFEIESKALEFGCQRFREHIRQYALCRERDEWPGYDGGVEVAGVPAWVGKVFSATL